MNRKLIGLLALALFSTSAAVAGAQGTSAPLKSNAMPASKQESKPADTKDKDKDKKKKKKAKKGEAAATDSSAQSATETKKEAKKPSKP